MSEFNPENTLISTLLLYLSFAFVSISFYAQLVYNWKRKKVQGLSIDYVLLGLFAYLHYALFIMTYYSLYFYIQFIRLDSTVIELLFSVHSFICFLLIATQAVFEWSKTYAQLSLLTKIVIPFSIVVTFLFYVFPIILRGYHFNFAAYALIISFYCLHCFKYCFQIRLNRLRKSTIGFNIVYCHLDLGGNTLAALYYSCNIYLLYELRWIDLFGFVCFIGGMIGNVCLMTQHWVLYSNSNSDLGEKFLENYLINKVE